MDSTDGLRRAMDVVETDGPIAMLTGNHIRGRIFNVIELATLHIYRDAWRCRCVTWAWCETASLFGRPSCRDSIVDCVARQAMRARRALERSEFTAGDDNSSVLISIGHSSNIG